MSEANNKMHASVVQAATPAQLLRAPQFLSLAIRHHAWVLALGLTYVSTVILIVGSIGRPYTLFDPAYVTAAMVPFVIGGFCVIVGHILHHVIHVRPMGLRQLWSEIVHDDKIRLRRIVYSIFPIALVILFQSAFTSYKTSITIFQPFTYDVLFMELDYLIHLGNHPWELLQPILGHPLVTSVISYFYKLWYGMFYLTFFFMAFSMRDPMLRVRYFLSYLLCWSLLGSVAATFLSSAGPCFYGAVVSGPNPYAHLMDYLHESGEIYINYSLEAQEYLWQGYINDFLKTGGGISAMPSVHVGIATLQALLGWRINRRLGWFLTIYCAIVLIGSVHLGWHYAIDGYVSIVLTIAIWKGVGYLMRFHPPLEPIKLK